MLPALAHTVSVLCTSLLCTHALLQAYGKTTYLITSLKLVPRGTEGAVSLEGTLAGLGAAAVYAAAAFGLGQVRWCGVMVVWWIGTGRLNVCFGCTAQTAAVPLDDDHQLRVCVLALLLLPCHSGVCV